jgi:uncharacterized membrane protein YkvA (DUF1232 family)
MINLSPFTREYTWEAATKQARRLLSKPKDIEALVILVRSMQERYAHYLGSSRIAIDTLVAWISCHNAKHTATEKTTDSAAALYYLANPYDGTFDFFRGIGLTDDLGVIHDVITKHFAI